MAGKNKVGYDFLVAELEKNPNAEYGELRDKAQRKGLAVFPIMYGRAKAALGLVKVSAYGTKKKRKRKTSTATANGRRRPGRPAKTDSSRASSSMSLSGIADELQRMERESNAMREALLEIRSVVTRLDLG